MTTADKIISLLDEKNIEQQQLASYLGVKKQTISDWKSGKTKSYMKHINKIAEFFGVSVDYLLGNTEMKKDDFMCKIPRLFELMAERGITAKKLSEATNISTGNISDWKSGRSKPSSEKVSILAKYFGVSIDYLLGAEEAVKGNDFMTTFLKNVLSLLKIKGVSKNKMLADLNLEQNSFLNWEQRGVIPNGNTLSKIANYFGVSIDYLLGVEETEKRFDDLDIRRIERARDKMPPEEKERMMTVIVNAFYKYFSDDYVDDDLDE